MSETKSYRGPWLPTAPRAEDQNPLVYRILMYRECTKTNRCHTVPYLGEPYSVGKHTMDALVLLLTFYPQASKDLIVALMFHDFPERWIGDLPAPAKWFNADLKKEYEVTERVVIDRKKIPSPSLTVEEARWLDIVDRLEFWCWCHDQIALGNRNVEGAYEQIHNWFMHQDNLPKDICLFMNEYVWQRTHEV